MFRWHTALPYLTAASVSVAEDTVKTVYSERFQKRRHSDYRADA